MEADVERQKAMPATPTTFRAAVNTTLFDCATSTGRQIVGCYAPTGDHAEKPLCVGLQVRPVGCCHSVCLCCFFER